MWSPEEKEDHTSEERTTLPQSERGRKDEAAAFTDSTATTRLSVEGLQKFGHNRRVPIVLVVVILASVF